MALVDDLPPLNSDLRLVDCNKNNDVTTRTLTSQQINVVTSTLTMDSSMASIVLNSNSYQTGGGGGSPNSRQSTISCGLSPDDTLNNDFYYDDEFAVQFDANISDFIASHNTGLIMTQSLNDVTCTSPDNCVCSREPRQHWMTSSRSDSCLYRPDVEMYVGRSQQVDSEEGEDMSTSDRQEDMVSSSEVEADLSDLQTSTNRPLFTPPPTTNNSCAFDDRVDGCNMATGHVNTVESMMSDSSSTGLDCGVYDFAVTKQQYVISFDHRTASNGVDSKLSSSGVDESFRASLERSGQKNSRTSSRDRNRSVTVGRNGGGLTTWKQVRGRNELTQPQSHFDTGLTTWQRLKALRGKGQSSVGTQGASDDNTQTFKCSDDIPMSASRDQSGRLLKMYCSSRHFALTPTFQCGTPVTARCGTPVTSCYEVSVVKYCSGLSESNCEPRVKNKYGERESGLNRSVRDRRRTHQHTKSFSDKSVQCNWPTFVDHAVQTSIDMTHCRPLLTATANKSLQTSTLVNNMVRSALLLSRPLPDLDFLRAGMHTTQVIASNPSTSGPPSKDVPQVENTNIKQEEKSKESVPRRSVMRNLCPNEQAARVRRHHSSDSAFSNNSSSSSGIDPGCYDSANLADKTTSMTVDMVPRKPPRLFQKGASFDEKTSQNIRTSTTREDINGKTSRPGAVPDNTRHRMSLDSQQCVLLRDVIRDVTTDKMASDSIEHVGSQPFLSSHSREHISQQPHDLHDVNKHLTSPHCQNHDVTAQTRLMSPRRTRRVREAALILSPTPPTSSPNDKPAKSILRRQRHQRNKALPQSSWSDNHDSEPDENSCSHSNDVVELPCPRVIPVTRRSERPLSLPDATVLYTDHTRRNPLIGNCTLPTQVEHPSVVQDELDGRLDTADPDELEQFRAKKSVSFSEKIFYHSMPPSVSPIESPMCPNRSPMSGSPVTIGDKSKQGSRDVTPTGDQPEPAELKVQRVPSDDEDNDNDLPPSDFTVSPPSGSPTTSLVSSLDAIDLTHKKELVLEVIRSVEALVNHFAAERDPSVKLRLGSTAENDEVGRLVVDMLCPALHAILLDGLRPHIRSFFGRVKNSAWKVVEDSVELGEPVELLQDLLFTVRNLKFLRTPWLLFNAFIISLLNVKALDFWLTHLYGHKLLMTQHYATSAFLSLSGSGVAAHRLFMDLVAAVQPLSQLPFCIEFDFELRRLERHRYRQLCSSGGESAELAGAVYTRPRRPSSVALQDVDVSQTLRTAFNRLGNRASQSLVLAKSALQNTSSVVASSSTRRPRPLSMPINLTDDLGGFGSGQSEVVSQEMLESSSGDSFDSVGFFRRFAGQFWSTSTPQGAVYRKGLTDYSFRESPEERPVASPADQGQGSTADTRRVMSSINQSQSDTNQLAKVSDLRRVTQIDPNRSTGNTSSESVGSQTRRNKRWSDFGTRLVGLVDKVLLPADQQQYQQQSAQRRSMDSTIGVNKCSSVGRLSDIVTTPTATDNGQSESDKLGHVSSYDVRMKRNIFNSVGGGASVTKQTSVDVNRSRRAKYVTTLCHCIASDDDQLSFQKGMQLDVVCDVSGSDWLLCRHGDREGLVHRACVKTVNCTPEGSTSCT